MLGRKPGRGRRGGGAILPARRERLRRRAWWFGQNLLGIGNYIADARAQRLPLVAGGVHDWTYPLETAGLLIYDEKPGRAVQVLGCLVMALSAAAVYVYWPRREGGVEAAAPL